jgi:phage N-6-adenine-methyltransferase
LVAHRWRKDFCLKGETGTIIDKDKMAFALDDAQARSLRVVERQPKGTERGTAGTGEFERYTPAMHIEAARKVLGTIDVDPASNALAQETVKAEAFFTPEDDGLKRMWCGNVWLNPPYHRELQPLFVDKLVAELKAGRVKQAIMLTNNSTDTEWFRIAAEAATAICFTVGRVAFTTPSGAEVAPTQGQTFFYFGDNPQKFSEVFAEIGFGVQLAWNCTA